MPSCRSHQLRLRDCHPLDEIRKTRIRPKGIDTRKLREDPGQVIPEAARCFEPFESCVEIPEAGMQHHEGDRRSLTLGR